MSDINEAAYNILSMASKFQEFFYGDSADVTFTYINDDGVQVETTVPNVAKTTYDLRSNGVTDSELATELSSYYKGTDVDSLLEQYYSKSDTDGMVSDVDMTNVMSKAQFEANAAMNREKFAGSGLVKWGGDYGYAINDGMWVDSSPEIASANFMFIGRSGEQPKINISGVLLNLFQIGYDLTSYAYGGSECKISVPENKLLPAITDSTNAPEMKQGDMTVLADLDREMLFNGTFDENIDGWVMNADERGTLEYDSDNYRLKMTSTVEVAAAPKAYVDFIVGVEYTYKFDVSCLDGVTFNFNYPGGDVNGLTSGSYTFTFVAGDNRGFIDFYFFGMDTDDKKIIYVDNVSMIQSSETPIVALVDTQSGDVYNNVANYEVRDSISRQDLVFLETWHESLTDKGTLSLANPFGNVQYRGNNTDGLSGIVDGTFDGADTYSIFGNWQEAGDLVGKGYVWANLSLADKIKFANNPENNVYRDGTEWVQVKYRTRVIKGLGNDKRVYTDGKLDYAIRSAGKRMAVKGAFAVNADYFDVTNWLPVNRNKYVADFSVYNEYPNNDLGTYGSDNYDTSYREQAIMVAGIQRRNPYIWHETFNPEGTARVYVDGSAIMSYLAPAGTITSLVDCCNPDLIATIDITDPTNASTYANILDGTDNPDTYKVTGTIASHMSGRPDGIYEDEVNERDVEDLRMSAHERNYDELREEYLRKAISGEIRGKDTKSRLISIGSVKTSSTATYDSGNHMLITFANEIADYNIIYDGNEMGTLILVGDNGKIFSATRNENTVDHIFYPYSTGARCYLYGYGTPENVVEFNELFPVGTTLTGYITVSTDTVSNNTTTHCDIIGDMRKLQDRIKLIITEDTTQTFNRNDYVLCTDTDNNSGTAGHYYRYLSDTEITGVHTNTTDGDANATDGHIDFSDDTIWIDLGDVGTLGGYSDTWLEHGVDGVPLLVGEDGETLLPVYNKATSYLSGCGLGIKLSKPVITSSNIKKVLCTNKEGLFIPVPYTADYCADKGFSYTTGNLFNIDTEHSYSDIYGYATEEEMLDLMIVKVYYEVRTNFLDLAINSEYINMNKYSMYVNRYDRLFGNQLLNKVCIETNYLSGMYEQKVGLIVSSDENGTSKMSTQQTVANTPINLTYPVTSSSAIKYFDYLSSNHNIAQLQFVFKELNYDSGNWGDNSEFSVNDNVSTTTDENGKTVLIGQKSFKLPYFIK